MHISEYWIAAGPSTSEEWNYAIKNVITRLNDWDYDSEYVAWALKKIKNLF